MPALSYMYPDQVVHMMLVTQYLDVLKEFALSGRATMVAPLLLYYSRAWSCVMR